MIIDETLLHQKGGITKCIKAKEIIFDEGDCPNFYYQIVKGKVKLNNYNADGAEVIQNVLGAGQSFGESFLFNTYRYPMNAVALVDSEVISLPKDRLYELIKEHSEIGFSMLNCLADRLYFKYFMVHNNSLKSPSEKVWMLLNYLKSFSSTKDPYSYEVYLTRQQ